MHARKTSRIPVLRKKSVNFKIIKSKEGLQTQQTYQQFPQNLGLEGFRSLSKGARQRQLARQMLGVEVPVEHGVIKPLPKLKKKD